MSTLYLGKIDVSKIDKSRLFKGAKGTYCDVTVWIDDSPSEDWKACSIQQSTGKDEEKIYLGNAKKWESTPRDISPQSEEADNHAQDMAQEKGQDDHECIGDLPF